MTELLPCPDCTGCYQEVGGQAIDEFYVLCECGATGQVRSTEAQAIEAWNLRTRPDGRGGQ